MNIQQLSTQEAFVNFEDTTSELLELVSSFNEREINIVPFKDSWTAAQVADHILKSNNSIIKALKLDGRASNRIPDERVSELRELFLNFNTKFKSPDFILPSQNTYQKDMLLYDLEKSIREIEKISTIIDLSRTIDHPAFGEVTKFEILYFVIVHTQRHIHQLKNIAKIIGQ